MGHQFLSPLQGVGRSIFSDPLGVGHPIFTRHIVKNIFFNNRWLDSDEKVDNTFKAWQLLTTYNFIFLFAKYNY